MHFIVSFTVPDYGRITSMRNIKDQMGVKGNIPPYKLGVPEDYYINTNHSISTDRKANAAFVVLGM